MCLDEIGEFADQLMVKAEVQFRVNTFLNDREPFFAEASTDQLAGVVRQFAGQNGAAPEIFGPTQLGDPPFAVKIAGRSGVVTETVKIDNSGIGVEPVAVADGDDRNDALQTRAQPADTDLDGVTGRGWRCLTGPGDRDETPDLDGLTSPQGQDSEDEPLAANS
jgi:hypothetical protein